MVFLAFASRWSPKPDRQRFFKGFWGRLLFGELVPRDLGPTLRFLALLVANLFLAFNAVTATEPSVDFVKDIRPILEKHCYECHAGDHVSSGLRLDVRSAAFQGGELYGPSIYPGMAHESPLYQFVADTEADLQMPPEGPPLDAKAISLLKHWIDSGAIWPAGVDTATLIDPKDHWAFKPIVAPTTPPVEDPSWCRDPIDQFVAERIERAGLRPSPEAEKHKWLRRVTFDLTGLPPHPRDVRDFLTNSRPDAYERVVERLFASPHYGERMAQHWLDVVRYADTHGFEVNTERPNAWPYRDYVIEAFNRDTAVSDFIREQLCGDQLSRDAATGFLVTASVLLPGQIGQDEPSKRLARQDAIDEIVVNIGQSFLGLSIGCARCHNHKFDPITQRDYFAMQAFVAGVEYEERPVVDVDFEKAVRDLKENLRSASKRLASLVPLALSGDERAAVNSRVNVERFSPRTADRVRLTILKTNRLEPCIDELEVFDTAGINVAEHTMGTVVTASGSNTSPNRHELRFVNDGLYGNSRSWMSDESGGGWVEIRLANPTEIDRVQWGRDRFGEFPDRLAIEYRIEIALDDGPWETISNQTDRQAYEEQTPALPIIVAADDAGRSQQVSAAWADYDSLIQRTRNNADGGRPIFAGRFRTPDTIRLLRRGDPEQPLDEVPPAVPEVLGEIHLAPDATDRERRRALADWITDSANPLTARVAVNRLWQWHFGTGLVDTPNDFGRHGSVPTHPQLLDYLASELLESNGSLRNLQKRIVLSSTYRQSTAYVDTFGEIDADTRLLWRYPLRRLDGESLRDAILLISNQLEHSMGGAGFDLFDKRGGLTGFTPIDQIGTQNCRRMIYAHRVRRERDAVFGAFDCPDGGQSTPVRRESTTPIQALNLMNSPMLLQLAEASADSIQAEFPESIPDQIEELFLRALARYPTSSETTSLEPIVNQFGLSPLCRALFNSNEFVYLP